MEVLLMSDFLLQIKEDLSEYAEKFPNIANINKDEWAFNFWVLDKLYSEDENLIEDNILDYNDKGIDAYVWHEDLLDLYIIQNKFYTTSNLSSSYVTEFLTRPLGYLETNTYTHSKELQDIFNKYKDDPDFNVYFYIYVTNNSCKTKTNIDIINKFNATHKKYRAELFSLDEIEQKYYKEPTTNKKQLTFEISTINKGTTLNINTQDYKMIQNIDARYALVPVIELYKLYTESIRIGYPIFEANIREYLGASGTVNKKILQTLEDSEDRINFFFYNNGVTMIVDDFTTISHNQGKTKFQVNNPQIVNGCQTVSTINEALSKHNINSLESTFKDTYVMLKILKIPGKDDSLQKLFKNIVTYNNSQNSINQKTFIANSEQFKRLQTEFERKGFLICIKQSDKNKYTSLYKKVTPLKDLNQKQLDKFGLKNITKTKDLLIDLEKFLQVILAFITNPQNAVQNKSKLLNPNTNQYNDVMNFIKDPEVTINTLLEIYLLYLRAEQEKKNSTDGRTPIPLYLIYCFAKYSCDLNSAHVLKELESNEKIEKLIALYKATIQGYSTGWKAKNYDKDYNAMIKASLENQLLDNAYSMASAMLP